MNTSDDMPAEPSSLVARLIDGAVATIRANAERLGELDRAIGDGDHGVNMLRGFTAIEQARASIDALPLQAALEAMGKILVMKVGGASGPLYGSLLMAMGKPGASLTEMLAAGVEAVKKRGKSREGEKTMLDVLIPVQGAWDEACKQGLGPSEAIARLERAADDGLESTRPLLATKGRAAFLRERSVGHLDPGACSSALLVRAACEAFRETRNP